MSIQSAFAGTWQRTCTSRGLGSFAALPQPAESFLHVERADGGALRWSFGSALGALRLGYTTNPGPAPPPPPPGTPPDSTFQPLVVAFGAGTGWGAWRPDGVLTLTLTTATGALATITYRLLDADTIAVSLVDVPSTRGGEGASLQEGFLFRLGEGAMRAT